VRRLVQVQVVDLGDVPAGTFGITKHLGMSRPVAEDPVLPVLRVMMGRHMVWARPGGAWNSPLPGASDEHFAVDADSGEKRRWRECADVLYGTRPLPLDAACARLRAMAADHPGSRLTAVPLEDGGWAVASGPNGCRIVLRRHAGRPDPARVDWSLLPSCLHGWLVTGNSLRELPSVDVPHGRSFIPAVHRSRVARPDGS
jgi:hypothetical protein